MLLRSFRHFLITVSETDSNEISSNLNFPLPFQINLKLPFFFFFPLVMFQKNCLFLQVGTCNPAPASPTSHKTSTAGGGTPRSIRQRHPFSIICSLWWDTGQASSAREFGSGTRSGSAGLPTPGGRGGSLGSLLSRPERVTACA